ncbi:MAG TPA: energy transducer TonB [Pyrinomonadaceae bacterium]|nr:energy transducer TonB [Pyrinomonadaceae bacterium]
MKILSTYILLFVLNLAVYSQNNLPDNRQAINPNTEDFSVDFPSDPLVYFSPDKSFSVHRLISEGNYYYVFSETENPDAKTFIIEKFIDHNKNKASVIETKNSKSPIYTFSDDEDFFHTILKFKTKNGSIYFHTISKTKENEAVDSFFDSIKISGETLTKPRIAKKNPANTENLQVNTAASKNPVNSSASNAVGLGNGSGSGSGKNNSAENTPQPKVSPLRILSRPRPLYTDIARFYNIEGTVTLKVTFLGTAKIGAITVVGKLPFGLTNSAIEAARQIQFEPLTYNEKPVNVTKTVQYSFTIY